MTNSNRFILFAATAALGAMLTTPASAAFITYPIAGTWEGKVTCNELTGGVKSKTVYVATLKISQLGLNFGVEVDYVGGGTAFYGGLETPDGKKPEQKGEAALLRCGSTDVLDASNGADIARLKVSTKPNKVKASMSGLEFFSAPSATPHFGTCKIKFKRTSDVDPGGLTQCGQPGLHTPPAQGGAL